MEENNSQTFIEVQNDLKSYLNTRLALLKLEATERVSKWLSALVSQLFVATFIMLFLVFGSLATALYLGELLNSNSKGFAIVALFCLFVGLIIYALKGKFIQGKLTDVFIKELLKEDEESSDNKS